MALTPDLAAKVKAFKERNASALQLAQARTPSQALFDSRRGRGDADAQEGGFYGGGKPPPPVASAAPVAGVQQNFVGLTTSLNDHQQELVKQKKRTIPDVYEIVFAPTNIGSSSLTRPGPQDTTTATSQNPDSASKLDMEKTQVDRSARTWSITGGTQIIKVIDDVMRNSSFITGQQNVEVSSATDPVTGLQVQKLNAKAGTGNMQWYKISVSAKNLGYDTIIRDYAYKITFIISPYGLAQMVSQYFPDSRYRGVHKAYQYWFTGENTQVLNYEQSYNNAWRLVLSGTGVDAQTQVTTDFRDQNRYIYMATSENQAQGAKNYANEAGNSGASFLYDPKSLSTVKMKIVGDPAWLQQGEVGLGVSAATFDFNPFNTDGSINYDSQAVMFSMAFNTPSDYDFNTGLVNVSANNRSGKPQEYYTFTAIEVKSTFSKGRFEQDIQGKLLVEKKLGQVQEARPAPVPVAVNKRVDKIAQAQAADKIIAADALANKNGSLLASEFGGQDELSLAVGATTTEPRPATPPNPPTSSGDIRTSPFAGQPSPFAGRTSPFAGTPPAVASKPQNMNKET